MVALHDARMWGYGWLVREALTGAQFPSNLLVYVSLGTHPASSHLISNSDLSTPNSGLNLVSSLEMSHVQFVALIRLPFARGQFVDPPRV
jgi:hypothetical protein